MTEQEISGLLAINQVAFPYAYKDMSKEDRGVLRNVWLSMFKGYDAKLVRFAFERALAKCKVPVTPADVIEQIEKIESAGQPNEDDIWQEFLTVAHKVSDLSSGFGYSYMEDNGLTIGKNLRNGAQRIFNQISQEIKSFCGGELSQLITYGNMSQSDLIQYVKPNFLKRLKIFRDREKVLKNTPPQLLEMVNGCTKKLINLEG